MAKEEKKEPQEQTEIMSVDLTPEELADLKAKADELAALKAKEATGVDKMAALEKKVEQVTADNLSITRARDLGAIRREVEQFDALPLPAPAEGETGGVETFAANMQKLKEVDAGTYEYFKGLLSAAHEAIASGSLFGQIAHSHTAEQIGNFEAAIQQELADNYEGKQENYADAAGAVAKKRPALYAIYKASTSGGK